jgi:hypothetical protein
MIHEHHQWLEDLNRSIVESYARDQTMAGESKRIQQTGHRVESRWDEVLSDWLPPQYEVDKRKYLLLETPDGPTVTRETDLVVFYPHYPEKLRTKESVLASGVAAAFSVKRTLNRDAIVEAFRDGVTLRRGMKIRDGTLRHHLVPPVFFGLLAESHAWKTSDNPKEKIKTITDELGKETLQSPREGLDFICVADLGCWTRQVAVLTEKFLAQTPVITPFFGNEAIVLTGMRHRYEDQDLSPLTNFIGSLWQKLAINDPSLKPLADGLRLTETDPTGGQSGLTHTN